MWRRQNLETVVTTNAPEDTTTTEEPRLGAESPLSTTMSPSASLLRSRSSSDETTNSTTRRSSWFAPVAVQTNTEGGEQQQQGDSQAQSSSRGLSLMIPRRPSLRLTTSSNTTAVRSPTYNAEIQKRDEMIASLTRTKLLLRKSLENLQEELLVVRRRSNMKLAAKNVELEATKNELTNVQSQLQQVLNDLQQQDSSERQNDNMAAGEGAPHLLSDDCPPHISDYIQELQQKLSSCIQKLKVLENHTSTIKQMHVEYAKSAQEDLVSINQERTLVEMEHLSKIDALEQEKLVSEQALLAKLEMKQVRIQHLEDMLDELRSQCIMMDESTSNSSSPTTTSGRMTPTQQEVEAIVAVGELKEALEQMTRARDDLETTSNHQIRTMQAEIERLTIMNEVKQKKIDEYECQDALETLESDVGEQIMTKRWNERETKKVVVAMVDECDDKETEEENGIDSAASVPPPKTPTATSNDGEQEEEEQGDTNEDSQQHLSRVALTPLASGRKDASTRNAGILSPTDPLAKMSESQRKLQVARLERYL